MLFVPLTAQTQQLCPWHTEHSSYSQLPQQGWELSPSADTGQHFQSYPCSTSMFDVQVSHTHQKEASPRIFVLCQRSLKPLMQQGFTSIS